ncbi:GP63 group I member a protein [Trypanosoma conorhini]|uniref:Leishmanolysin-like peptidase n=1 Tax=Trypanosoma conorhini TaxID=83891 RepID=A0A422PDJ3_9TRYP|nr:GP63 group I member a protein [Trypanosoma conorhini]RNF15776.1 GP63 group I member a protein [Trypanosoma conorhini]
MGHAFQAILLLLCCANVGLVHAERRCIVDELANKSGPLTTVVELELPNRDRGMAQFFTASVKGWAPIRIMVFTEDLSNPSKYCIAAGESRPDFTGGTLVCENYDIFTPEKRSILVNKVIPQAIKMHMDRLLVEPLENGIVIPIYTFGICSEFTVPSSHHTTGVFGADMYLYAATGPSGGSVLAWALTCSLLMNGRPVVGVINFPTKSISDTEYSIRVFTHEVAHTLGFFAGMMRRHSMVHTASGVRGKPNAVLFVSSPNVLEVTRKQYNCTTAPGMELEDEGGGGTALSHWKRRNAKDELMAGIAGVGYYTALTMAAFVDMGFYRAQWEMAEPMAWGKNSGCDLLTQKCLTNGVTEYPEMFCTSPDNPLLCTSDRLALGYCAIYTHQNALPAQFRYFTNPKIGGTYSNLMDYCPYIEDYFNTRCLDGSARIMPGSRVGPLARCFKTDGLHDFVGAIGDVCADVLCENETLKVRYYGDSTWHACPEGGNITPRGFFTGGIILCPSYIEVCFASEARSAAEDMSNLFSIYSSIAVFVLFTLLILMYW